MDSISLGMLVLAHSSTQAVALEQSVSVIPQPGLKWACGIVGQDWTDSGSFVYRLLSSFSLSRLGSVCARGLEDMLSNFARSS